MGVFRVRLSESAQSGSARQVLQSLWIVGQTRVIGDMLHVVESCVNDFTFPPIPTKRSCKRGLHPDR